jgi:hypothetical protein
MRHRMVSMLLSLLNLRLGYWMANPISTKRRIPNFISPGLRAGFFGRGLREDADLLELTDGGHFENLGVYELIRRELPFIIVSDAGADPGFQFSDLANLVERVRVDFGAKIDFSGEYNLDGLLPGSGPERPEAQGRHYRLAARAFAVGTIRYRRDPPGKPSGVVVYFKTTMTPDLPADILGYKAANPQFPDQGTSDQFFDEAQFEAYRELGYHAGWQWLAHRAKAATTLSREVRVSGTQKKAAR